MRNKGNSRKLARILGGASGLLLALTLTMASAMPVLAVPQLPHRFDGAVIINGSPASAGVTVSATINGVSQTFSVTTNSAGNYSSLHVNGDDTDTPAKEGGVNGDTIQFYVSGTPTGTATFSSGSFTVKDLSVSITHTITVTQGANGTISPGTTTVNNGDGQTFTITPNSGFTVSSVIVDGTSVGAVTSYTFTNVTALHTITATFTAVSVGGGGGGGGGTPQINTNFFGTTGSFNTNSSGVIQTEIKATSADGKLTIDIPVGTKALDKYGNPLTSVTASINSNPPLPPANANIIGLAYNFLPAGATFVPAITFTWSYDPATLAGVAEEDLVIAYYDTATGEWVELPCVVDEANNEIIASVSHYTTFAIIGALKPAAFTLSSLVVSPVQVAPGEKVDINLSVANTGGTEGSYTVVLNINGVKEAEKSVTVAAGSIQTVSFSVTKEKAGSYSVAVDGLNGSFTVVATTTPPTTTPPTTTPPTTTPPTTTPPTTTPPTTTPPTTPSLNWLLVGGIIAAVVVVGLVSFFLIRRRSQ
ncbi:MAG: hypothetical protein PHQ43_03165 [Dehalococcoidales bacterium]|nr:hypothetical protein [Dehalococcoidales bacterium]